MKQIWQELKARRAEVAAHPFFVWLNSDSVALEDRFVFAPVMIDFIMSFADMNKWFLSYENPANGLERGINQHTEEDRTHSRLFYENWYSLSLGATANWSTAKVLWWLFLSRDAAVVRRFGMEILDATVNHPEALVRFAMMEAIEICGDVFFENTAPIAAALSDRHGVAHDYFGHYHRERETGHLHTDEEAFLDAVLDAEQRRAAHTVVHQVFDNFLLVLDQLLSYAERAIADAHGHERELHDEYLLTLTPPERAAPEAAPRRPANAVVSASQLPLLRKLAQRRARLEQHPFLEWLRHDELTPPDQKLRSFLAVWGIDIIGYKDMNELVLRYAAPKSDAERALNRWSEELATHGALYLQDWKALRMDRLLRWDMGQTIAYYFLSAQTEVHRANMAKVKKYAMRHQQAPLRFWLMYALESAGEPLFACTAPIARQVEREQGVVLHYWAGRHELAHAERAPAPELDAYPFLAESLSRGEVEVALAMIDTIFDNIEEEFAVSHEEAAGAVFLREAASLPPPRRSELRALSANGNVTGRQHAG